MAMVLKFDKNFREGPPMPVEGLTEHDGKPTVKDVRCIICKAEPGYTCRNPNRRPAGKYHRARIETYKEYMIFKRIKVSDQEGNHFSVVEINPEQVRITTHDNPDLVSSIIPWGGLRFEGWHKP